MWPTSRATCLPDPQQPQPRTLMFDMTSLIVIALPSGDKRQIKLKTKKLTFLGDGLILAGLAGIFGLVSDLAVGRTFRAVESLGLFGRALSLAMLLPLGP